MSECYMTLDGEPGPDYRCARCTEIAEVVSDSRLGLPVRLYRLPHNAGELLCVVHAMSATRIPIDPTFPDYVGEYLPARPVPEGDNIWGNGAGDIVWWYSLPKWRDAELEAAHVRDERLRFLRERDEYIGACHARTVEVLELRHTLSVEQQTKVPGNAARWRAALVKINHVQLDDVGTNTPDYTTETSLKMRLVAEDALRR